MKRWAAGCLLLWPAAAVAAPTVRLTLEDAERNAIVASPSLRAAESEAGAAQEGARSAYATLFPRLTFDATGRYQSVVPKLSLAPGMPSRPFGDNESYSIGPTISWTAWNAGSPTFRWKSARAAWESKQRAAEAVRRQVRLDARVAYFNVQLGLEQVRLLADSLNVAEAQYEDIRRREKAGAASRIDALSFHQDVLSRRRQLRQAQADLAGGVRRLYAVAGATAPFDATVPMDARVAGALPADVDAPTVFLALDAPGAAESLLSSAASRPWDDLHPQLASLAESADAARLAAQSVSAGRWPLLQVSARRSLDYPNGPVLEKVNQNTLSGSVSVPLFEARRRWADIGENRRTAEALDERRAEAAVDLERRWAEARDGLAALRSQRDIDRVQVQETETLARLTYDSYRAGRSNSIDVQSANLRALEAKVTAARTEAQTLIELAILDSLSKGEDR